MADIKLKLFKPMVRKGMEKELNLVSWNGKEPKYDLREWVPEHEKIKIWINIMLLLTVRDYSYSFFI